MANINAPFGFLPDGVLQGMVPNLGHDNGLIALAYATQTFKGDPLVRATSGYLQQAAAGTTQIAGVFFGGVEYYSIIGKIPVSSPYWPGAGVSNVDGNAQFISNSNATFIAQTGNSNTAASPATQANVGMTANFALGAGGNTTTGASSAYLDLYQAGSVVTQPFKILALASSFLLAGAPGSDDTTPYNWVLVGLNFAESRSFTGHA